MAISKRKERSMDNYSVGSTQATTYKTDGSLNDDVTSDISDSFRNSGHDFAECLPLNIGEFSEKPSQAYSIQEAIRRFLETNGNLPNLVNSPLSKILSRASSVVGGYEMYVNLCGEDGFLKNPTDPESFSKLGKGIAGGAGAFGGPVGTAFAGGYAIGDLANELTDHVLGGKGRSAFDILASDPLISKFGDSMGNFNEALANEIVGLTDSAGNLLKDENEQENQLPGSINPLRRMQQIQQENHRPRVYLPLR